MHILRDDNSVRETPQRDSVNYMRGRYFSVVINKASRFDFEGQKNVISFPFPELEATQLPPAWQPD
jgi:hypothetical protein